MLTQSGRFTAWLVILGVNFHNALAQTAPDAPPPDKSVYHLFNPVPREYLRGMNTDRPDQTESPYTVDAGHFRSKWILPMARWIMTDPADATCARRSGDSEAST